MESKTVGLAKLLREHRRCRSTGYGYICVCGASLSSNSMKATSEHQAEKVAEYFASLTPAPANPKPTAEDLLDTRAGLALANEAYRGGLSAGIRACNESLEGEPFVKPVSPYSAPLLALIKADKETLDHSPCCSLHDVPMTCERYRRTHFVEVRPCCPADAELLEQEFKAGQA